LVTFCTISTESHLFKTYALADSLRTFGGALKVLIVDSDEVKNVENIPSNVQFHFLEQLSSERIELTKKAYKKDKLRWALKPAYLLYLLSEYQELIYLDNDIFFYNGYNFLFEELQHSDLLLTPHFYPSSPQKDQTWLEANFRLGLYNAGFIGVNRNGKKALEWWSDCCLYEMKRAYWRGLFDDQKYLDLLPVLFNNVRVIKHRGCNFAGWNNQNNLKEEEIIFIHYNRFTVSKFQVETSLYFNSFLQYLSVLNKYKPNFKFAKRGATQFKFKNALYFLRWKLARMLK
jgi:hypothetical protein